jgi:nanoRNase/pAp phosphatase (c-di-AMP/oligoRNAs hydrolase)
MSRLTSHESRDPGDKHGLLADYIHASNRILILTHQNADPDAVCAAFSIRWLIKKLNGKAEARIISPEGVSEQAKSVLSRFKIDVEEGLEGLDSPPDLSFMVDTSSMWTLGPLKERVESMVRENPIVLVDHHHPDEGILKYSPLAFIDEEATSTCEVVFKLYKGFGVTPSKKISQILLTGTMFDSRHFMIANSETFEFAAEMCRLGASPSASAEVLHMVAGLSERIARLKAAQRCRIYRVKDWIIAISNLSSYQASGARALVSLGADLAVVMGEKGHVCRVNLRAAESFVGSTGIHLGRDLADDVGRAFDGSGGGHSSAAGIIVEKGSLDKILSHIIGRISGLLGAPLREVKK